jgi:RNA-binding protein
MDKKRIMELRGKAQALKATVFVGKDGMTETVVQETAKQLKKTKLVKIKLLSSVEADKMDLANSLARSTSSTLIEVRGRTVVLASE